jgi:hypothetical protein
MESCPSEFLQHWPILLSATSFGAGAQFSAIGGEAVLVAGGDAPWRVVRIYNEDEAATAGKAYSVWAFPSGNWRGIDVTEGLLGDETFRRVFALACDDLDSRCALLRSDEGDTASLSEWPGTELPAGFEPKGLVFDSVTQPSSVCAFGNGLLCFQTTWQEAIAPAKELQIDDVSMGDSLSVAVGNHGRYWKRERDASDQLGSWVEQRPVGEYELTSASVGATSAVIISQGGLWLSLGTQTPLSGCRLTANLVGAVLRGDDYQSIVTESGSVLEHLPRTKPEDICESQRLNVGSILGTATVPCRLGDNLRVLTISSVAGLNLCIRTID